ncbi:unnamed protein product [[Candida] boidinii]|nr:unnamed protein product [[Candida] boidinii]
MVSSIEEDVNVDSDEVVMVEKELLSKNELNDIVISSEIVSGFNVTLSDEEKVVIVGVVKSYVEIVDIIVPVSLVTVEALEEKIVDEVVESIDLISAIGIVASFVEMVDSEDLLVVNCAFPSVCPDIAETEVVEEEEEEEDDDGIVEEVESFALSDTLMSEKALEIFSTGDVADTLDKPLP